MPAISLPAGNYAFTEPRASCRRLVNCFSELAPGTDYESRILGLTASMDLKAKDPPIILRRTPGIANWCTLPTNGAIRGMHMMAGTLYVVAGSTLYSVSAVGNPTQLATGLAGTNRVFMADNGYCLVIILPGETTGYTWASGALATISASVFTSKGALNVAYIDSYIVFLANNGLEFYNSDSQTDSGTGAITFNSTNAGEFVREFGTDLFLGMAVNNRTIYMFGQLTSEAFINAGNQAGSPFDSAPNNFMELGCINGQTVLKVNQTVVWVANDRTVRVLEGDTPLRISNHGIESILESAYLDDAYALTYTVAGHIMYVLTMPTDKRTLVYDFLTRQWHEMTSYVADTLSTTSFYNLGYWRPFSSVNAYGLQLVGDSQSATIGELSTTTFTEYGVPIAASWTHQSVYVGHNRVRHKRLEMIMGTGANYTPLPGQINYPVLSLAISDDGGNTFRNMPTRSLGQEGQRYTRAVWYNLGMSRERVYKFTLSDPTELWGIDAQLEYDLALH